MWHRGRWEYFFNGFASAEEARRAAEKLLVDRGQAEMMFRVEKIFSRYEHVETFSLRAADHFLGPDLRYMPSLENLLKGLGIP